MQRQILFVAYYYAILLFAYVFVFQVLTGVEFTGSLNLLHDTERRTSSSSSIRLFFTQIDDKDETDDTIKSMMLYL